jgi:hypothetical protein
MKRFKKNLFILIITMLIFSGTAYGGWIQKRLTWNPGGSVNPSIAIDSQDNIYVVWHDYTPGESEIFLKKSTTGGTSWTQKRLSWNSGGSYIPKIAIDSQDNIYVVWYDNTPGNGEIFLKKSTNGGTSWTQKQLTWNSEYSLAPSIAIDSQDNIYVVWYGYKSGDYEIFLKKSTTGGTSWTQKRLTWNLGDSPGLHLCRVGGRNTGERGDIPEEVHERRHKLDTEAAYPEFRWFICPLHSDRQPGLHLCRVGGRNTGERGDIPKEVHDWRHKLDAETAYPAFR